MFEGLQEDQLQGAVEAMLFVTDEPVGILTLAEMLECEPAQVESALFDLRERLEAEDRGIQLREVACSHGTLASSLEQLWRPSPS